MMFVYGLWVSPIQAQDTARLRFDIDAATMDQALLQFGEQAGLSVLSLKDHIKNIVAPKLKGRYSKEEALKRLISHSNLCFEFGADHTSVTVDWCSILHPARQPPVESESPPRGTEPGPPADASNLETVVITGSNIHRPRLPDFQPQLPVGPRPIILTREDFIRYDVTSLADLGRLLPQIFGGGP
jgi:hypothetical protein